MTDRGAALPWTDRPLLAAKYAVPPARPGGVTRSRLHARLLDNGRTRLTTVIAPAGWGKTTLLSQWAHDPAERRQLAWVSLDSSDDEPTRFWTYALTALAEHGVGAAALAALGAQGLDPVDVVLPLLLNELASCPARHVLVLDDYHVLADPHLHEGVEFLLAYLPPSLHLVLAGRADPPIPLPRLRARGELTEIRISELGFSSGEAGALVAAVAGVTLEESAVRVLQERTEGWAAGLQLAALTLHGRSDDAAIEEIRGDDRHILDFFSTEVLERLPADQRELLVATSVLERLSGPLCDAVLARYGTAAILADLDRADLFVVPLDNRREWYRCHRLFRDALRSHLDPATEAVVLGRAADWFREQGFLEDAITLKIDGGDERGAIDLLKTAAVPWILEHGASNVMRLAGRLSPDLVRSDSSLCGSLAWAALLSGQFQGMSTWLDAAEAPRDPEFESDPPYGWHSLVGCISTLRSTQLLATNPGPDSVTLAERGVASESDPTLPGYVLARYVLGTTAIMDERPADAIPVLYDAWRHARGPRFPPLLGLQAACSLALALFRTARYPEADRVCRECAPAVQVVQETWGETAVPLVVARLQMVEGQLALLSGDLPEADRLTSAAATASKVWGLPSQIVLALTALAEVKLARDDLPAARTAVAEAREVVAAEPVWPFAARELDELDVRLGRGALRAARRPGVLLEELTDRELTLLRMLPGTASQREIGAALFLSINTVKGYAKSLYRKLDVSTRQEAVHRARELHLI